MLNDLGRLLNDLGELLDDLGELLNHLRELLNGLQEMLNDPPDMLNDPADPPEGDLECGDDQSPLYCRGIAAAYPCLGALTARLTTDQ
jgi:hypothetical protein